MFFDLFIIHPLSEIERNGSRLKKKKNTTFTDSKVNNLKKTYKNKNDITFSMNCVLESMRKSLKTVCRQLSVALVSRIRPSSCFSISWVFDSIL